MKKLTAVFLAMLTMAMSVQAHAGLKDLKNLANPEAAAQSSAVSEEAIVQNFAGAFGTVLQGQAELNLAFGFKEKAAELRSTAEALTSGSTLTQKDIEAAQATSEEAKASYEAKIAEGAELSDEGREHYLKGLVLSADGVNKTKGLAADAAAFGTSAKDQLASASMLKKAKLAKKLAAGMFVAKELPGFTTELVQNFGLLVSFAKSADIPVPDDATDLLAAL